MWETMARLYHPQWTRTNGEIGGAIFQDWAKELLPYGAKGVLVALQGVRDSGSAYLPPLAKFMSMGRAGNEDSQHSTGFGQWEVCPFTGLRRRLKPGYEAVPNSDFIEFHGSVENAKSSILRYCELGQPADWTGINSEMPTQ